MVSGSQGSPTKPGSNEVSGKNGAKAWREGEYRSPTQNLSLASLCKFHLLGLLTRGTILISSYPVPLSVLVSCCPPEPRPRKSLPGILEVSKSSQTSETGD